MLCQGGKRGGQCESKFYLIILFLFSKTKTFLYFPVRACVSALTEGLAYLFFLERSSHYVLPSPKCLCFLSSLQSFSLLFLTVEKLVNLVCFKHLIHFIFLYVLQNASFAVHINLLYGIKYMCAISS